MSNDVVNSVAARNPFFVYLPSVPTSFGGSAGCMKSIKREISFGFIICSHWSVLGPVDDAPFDPRFSRDVIGVQMSVYVFVI